MSVVAPGTSPDVSIIIPAYNAASTLDSALESILQQEGPDFEVLIVDDGSTDSTFAVAQRFATTYPNVTALTQSNQGTAAALNAGRRMAKGSLIAHLDSDDRFTEDYLSSMCAFIHENPDFDMYSHDLWRVDVEGGRSRVYGWTESLSLTLDDFLSCDAVVGPGTIIRSALFDRLGGYAEGVYNEDYEFWLRALMAGARHIYCPHPLYLYIQHSGQKTRDYSRVYSSLVEIVESALQRGFQTDDQTRAAQFLLDKYRKAESETRVYGGFTGDQVVGERAAVGAQWLRAVLDKTLPHKLVEPALVAIHTFSWLVRPFREWLWKVSARAAARRG